MPVDSLALDRRAWLGLALAGAAAAALGTLAARQRRPALAAAPDLPDGDVCLVAPATPYDPASGLAPTAPRPVPAQARCPVCGMYPARSREWAAQAIHEGGDAHFFDSPLSLFMYLHERKRYGPAHASLPIAAIYVTDSSTQAGGWIAARSAWFVHGSNARGPMRAGNLPAFATPAAAQAFARQRGGRVLAYAEVDGPLVAALAGEAAGHGGH